MTIDEIKGVLEKNGYALDSDTILRIQTMLQSIRDDNQINKLDYVIDWFNKKREESDMIVEEIGINELDKWNVDPNSGNIKHESGGFFEVIGVKASNTFDREVGKKGWTQPMIAKNPGGILGIMILGFQRAAFSNEAGIGSAAIAHATVKTQEPVTEGYVGLMEPFIDTVVICTLTALVILTTVYEPAMASKGIQGIALTSQAFSSTLSWSVLPLSFIAILFAFSTILSWSYYGLKGWTYIVGESAWAENIFKVFFCIFIALGCTINLTAVLDFSDAVIFVVALPNILGLYILAPAIKKELANYQRRLKSGEIKNFRENY